MANFFEWGFARRLGHGRRNLAWPIPSAQRNIDSDPSIAVYSEERHQPSVAKVIARSSVSKERHMKRLVMFLFLLLCSRLTAIAAAGTPDEQSKTALVA